MMNIVTRVLMALVCTGVFAIVIVQQHTQLNLTKVRAQQAELELARQQAQLVSLQTIVNANQQLLTTLQHKQRQIHTTLSRREQDLEHLLQQNASLRAWGNTALPDDIIRLRQHTPVTGADAYLEHLSASNPVPASGLCTADQSGTGPNVGTNRSSMGAVCGAD